MLDVSVALNTIEDSESQLDFIARTTLDVMQCGAASILLFDDTTGALRFVAATGAGAVLVGEEVPLKGSLAGATFSDNRILHAVHADEDARRYRDADAQTGFSTRSLLGVPMRIDGQPVGVLQALNPKRERFDSADAEALLIIAAQAAVAIRGLRHEKALQRANDRLAELDRLKSSFMAIASHELRTPLTAIQGFGQILLEEVRGELHMHADAIVRAGERMMDVVETVDVMSSLNATVGSHPGVMLSLSSILASVIQEEAPHAEVAMPEGPLLVEGAAPRLRLALRNLIRNAVQFSEPDAQVSLEARVDAGEIRIAIADAGRGLEAGALEDIFEPYHQVANPDQRDHEGLGLGLTVARAVVRQHGGQLWAESPGLGRGSTFHVRLPLAEA
ncbi:ATP-binding protein [Rubrivirga sp.]|uniref:GAF domain-containing sensor histidine kinase n=1 Tax=Rubrivirga sp. TaxID=1885344 RepID=UPI003C7402B8